MTRPDFEKHIATLEALIASCIERRDWHGVCDAAIDLRVLEATRGTFDQVQATAQYPAVEP